MCKTLERIKQFIDYKGLSISAFEKSIGMSNASFSKSLKNKGAIGTDKLENILRVYPELSPAWLLTGTGTMLKEEDAPARTRTAHAGNTDAPTRPHLPVTAAAGALNGIAQSVTDADCELMPLIHSFPSYDFTITIDGDSMMPDYHSGDDLVCAFVTDTNNINWGKPHVIDSREGVNFKRIYDGGDSILCRSINPAYDDYEVSKDDIFRIAKVVGCIRRT